MPGPSFPDPARPLKALHTALGVDSEPEPKKLCAPPSGCEVDEAKTCRKYYCGVCDRNCDHNTANCPFFMTLIPKMAYYTRILKNSKGIGRVMYGLVVGLCMDLLLMLQRRYSLLSSQWLMVPKFIVSGSAYRWGP